MVCKIFWDVGITLPAAGNQETKLVIAGSTFIRDLVENIILIYDIFPNLCSSDLQGPKYRKSNLETVLILHNT